MACMILFYLLLLFLPLQINLCSLNHILEHKHHFLILIALKVQIIFCTFLKFHQYDSGIIKVN